MKNIVKSRKKPLDVGIQLCYNARANGRTQVFFFVPKIDSKYEKHEKKQTALQTMKLNGGGSRAHKDYTGMYRMQAAQLQYDKG